MEQIGKVLGFILIFILVICYGTIMGGVIVSKFWSWFIIPVFNNLPIITWVQGMGISMFIGLFKYIDTNQKFVGNVEIKTKTNWGLIVAYLPIILLFGYILHLIIKN